VGKNSTLLVRDLSLHRLITTDRFSSVLGYVIMLGLNNNNKHRTAILGTTHAPTAESANVMT